MRVSELGLGTKAWGGATSSAEATGILREFLNAGGSLVDTAPSYGGGAAQETLAISMRELGLCAGGGRERIVLSGAAGVFPDRPLGRRVDCSKRAIVAQLDATLAELGVDHLDVFSAEYWDDQTPIDEVLEALHLALSSGKARYIGVRGYRGWQLATAAARLTRETAGKVVVAQAEYNLLARGAEVELLPAAEFHGAGFFAGAALAQGILTGSFAPRSTPTTTDEREVEVHGLFDARSASVLQALTTAATGLGIAPEKAALAWLLGRDGVSAALSSPRDAAQLRAIVDVTGLKLPQAIVGALDEISA